jgi:hypothetical protein
MSLRPTVRVIAAPTVRMSLKFDIVQFKICPEFQILLKASKKYRALEDPSTFLSPTTVKSLWMCSG